MEVGRNISPNNANVEVKVHKFKGSTLVLVNPGTNCSEDKGPFLIGSCIEGSGEWKNIGGPFPDGNYALIRTNNSTIEVLTDRLASTTVWYYHGKDGTYISNSQRAIIMMLGSFKLNREALKWFLAAGNLGPGNSWDYRIKTMGPDSIFSISLNSERIKLERKIVPEKGKYNVIQQVMKTAESINTEAGKWILSLSGGYDSRFLLKSLRGKDFDCVTWGTDRSYHLKSSDPSIATKLAILEEHNIEMKQLEMCRDTLKEDIYRFAILSECRTDNISAYIDGMQIWKNLFEKGYRKIIRGDEVFGAKKVFNEKQVYQNASLVCFSDMINGAEVKEFLGGSNIIPGEYMRKNDESLFEWRERIFQSFEARFIFPSLNSIKEHYMDICNPFLYHSVVDSVNRLSPNKRSSKTYIKNRVKRFYPSIAFSTSSGIESLSTILSDNRVKEIIWKELDGKYARGLFSDKMIEWMRSQSMVSERRKPQKQERIQRWVEHNIPHLVLNFLVKKDVKLNLDHQRLIFRCFLVSIFIQHLEKDNLKVQSI